MKIRPISYTFLVATLYVACVLPRAACDRQTIHDGVHGKPEELNPSQENPLLYGGVITSEDQDVNTVYRGFFDELAAAPRKNADQVTTFQRQCELITFSPLLPLSCRLSVTRLETAVHR